MTIKETIKAIELKVTAQKSMLQSSRTDSARMRCINTLEALNAKIKELKSL
jgi:hypothetical protein